MIRIPIATSLKTRTGVPAGKDARLVNSYVETKGDHSVVRKRPIAQGGIAVGTGTAQGGIGLTINGTPTLIGFWGDTIQTYTGSGTSWNSGTSYVIGDHVAVNFVDYWALSNNSNSQPPNSNWSETYFPAVPSLTSWTLGTMALPSYNGNHPIAWNGTIYVYLADDPISGFAVPFTSTDGLNWTQQAEITGLTYAGTGFYSINWNGSQFLAVGGYGTGVFHWATSANGTSWIVHTDAAVPDLFDVAWNGTNYCAVGNGDVYTSTTGLTWTVQANPGGNYRAIEWNGTVFCIAGRLSAAGATSPTGETWTATTLPANTSWERIKVVGSIICITAGGSQDNYATSSNNGASWSSGSTGVLGGDGLTSSGSLFLVTTSAISTASYATSSDGITWVTRSLPSAKLWFNAAYGAKFVVMDNTTVCATSSTGL